MSAIRGGDQQQLSNGCVASSRRVPSPSFIQRQVVPGILKHRIIRKVANLGGNMMSKWCLTVALGALLALPSFAKHKNTGVEDGVPTTTGTAETSDASNAVNVAPAPDFFAMPAMPRATPFPAAAEAPVEEPGQVVPRYEVALMYEYINFRPGDPFRNFNNHGGTGSFTFNATRWLGLNFEAGGTQYTRDISPLAWPKLCVRGLDEFSRRPAHRIFADLTTSCPLRKL